MYVLCVCLDENKEMMKNGSLKKKRKKEKERERYVFQSSFLFF